MEERTKKRLVGAVLACVAIAAEIVLLCVFRSVRYFPDKDLLQIAPILAAVVAFGTFMALRTEKLCILGDVLLALMAVLSVVACLVLL